MSQKNKIEAEKLSPTTDFLPSGGASCSPSSTPETDAAAYEATTRTVGKWIVPIAKARKVELERNAYRRAYTSGECMKCLLNGWDPASKGPCPSYPECGRSFPENSQINGGIPSVASSCSE